MNFILKLFKLKHIPIYILTGLILVTAGLLYVLSMSYAFGSSIGGASGSVVGIFEGSISGLTEGRYEGSQDGLKAEDTEVEIFSAVKGVGKLQVLVAGVTLKNMHEAGDAYKSLSLTSGELVFTVDLSDIEIGYSQDGDRIIVLVSSPEPSIYLDHSSTELLAEIQNFSWTVSAEDGLQAYLNSMSQIETKIKENVSNYDELVLSSKESAIYQIEQLIKSSTNNDKTVIINFNENMEVDSNE